MFVISQTAEETSSPLCAKLVLVSLRLSTRMRRTISLWMIKGRQMNSVASQCKTAVKARDLSLVKLSLNATHLFFQRGRDFLTLYKFRCDQKRIVIRACVLTHSATEIMLGQATTESGFKDHYIKRVLGLKDLWLSKIVETRQSWQRSSWFLMVGTFKCAVKSSYGYGSTAPFNWTAVLVPVYRLERGMEPCLAVLW